MFLSRGQKSKDYAKDRLKTVLMSERIDCSAQMLLMMKNDVILSAGKYLPVNEEEVVLRYAVDRHCLEAVIPLLHSKAESEQ